MNLEPGYDGPWLDKMGGTGVQNRFDYAKMDYKVVRLFLAQRRNKQGKMCSYEDIRKTVDAVKYGSRETGRDLPAEFVPKMKMFLDSYRKKYAAAKQRGEVADQSSDPITFEMFKFMCRAALSDGDVFLWCWLVWQWQLMCRSVNVETLVLDLFGVSEDAMTAQFAVTKTGQSGEKAHLKHVYANPLEPTVCAVTALAVYLSVVERAGTPVLFEGPKGSQAKRFNDRLLELLKKHRDALTGLGLTTSGSNLSTHGLRKGAATYCATGSTHGPGIIAICLRADWSFGSTLSKYLFLEGASDQFLGRTVAGLPIHQPEFAILPPHFPDNANANVIAATKEQFSVLWESYPHFRGNLIMCVASLVYHVEHLREGMGLSADLVAQLFATPVLADKPRLERLTALVKTGYGTNAEGALRASGIPPHTEVNKQLSVLSSAVHELSHQVETFGESAVAEMTKAMKETWEADAATRGIITQSAFEAGMKKQTEGLMQTVEQLLSGLPGLPPNGTTTSPSAAPPSKPGTWQKFLHKVDGLYPTKNGSPKFYDVPENWAIPTDVCLKQAWMLWQLGDMNKQICPFKFLSSSSFGPNPKSIKLLHGVDLTKAYPKYASRIKANQTMLTEWKRIMSIMEEGVKTGNAGSTGSQVAAGAQTVAAAAESYLVCSA